MHVPQLSELDRNGITDVHRIAMANCVLEWATCESHLRALLTSLEGRPLDSGAFDYSRTSPDDCWKKISKLLRSKGATEQVLEAVQNNRAASREFYEARKLIVHSGCPGVWSTDPQYLLFAPFESKSAGEMLIVWVPLSEIYKSGTFARGTTDMVQKIMLELGF